MVATFLMPSSSRYFARERTLDGIRRAGAEVARVGALRVSQIRALGQSGVCVGRRHLNDLRPGQNWLYRLRDRGVEGTDDPDHLIVTSELRGRVLADVRLGLVVLGVDLQRPSGDGLLLVGLLDGQIDRVLDAERPELTREPDKGAITPILATLAAPASPPGACSARLPHADIASDAASRATPAITTLCLRTFPPVVRLCEAPRSANLASIVEPTTEAVLWRQLCGL